MVIELVGMTKLEIRGFIGSGSVTLETAAATDGAAVKGSFTAKIYEGPPKRASPE